ncbi:hypothetical protein PRZ48_000301 [Zasmidium cellare]|uniref:Endosomal peripheral membrane protein n=1 Tax=Zasmidium cellare TaxID=395010 RepID=A0ABR0EY31_ZASCE|nr:hypothetical protein PRZ48_000301 [Zasmidium cellare]
MSATLLSNELSNLSSEAKRKNGDLRAAADKSLQELKSLPTTSEQQLAADLSRRPAFIEPFLIACKTRNAKFAGSGIACLQRLVISKGLPKSRLNDALEAFNSCTDLGLDVQLKILQALPSLLQNYAADLEGDLLSGALQLVTTVFEKVATEDRNADSVDTTAEVPGDDGPIHLRPAAFDAYRVFRDLALAADERRTKFVQFTSLSVDSSLELIWSCIDSNPELFEAHDELMSIIGANVFPIVVRALSERLPFSVTVRSIRILDLVLDRYLSAFAGDCEVALSLCVQVLEPEAVPAWKRALVMEILRDFFADSNHVVDAYTLYDYREGGKPIVQDIMSTFVRLSTEKPSAIGLSQQSTVPTGPSERREHATDQATLEAAGGMAGVISSALGVMETNVAGISSQWSLPKLATMEQLDKSDPPTTPETYLYAMVLDCLNGLSDCLARIVLPLTVQHERNRSKVNGTAESNGSGRQRSTSFRTQAVPINPLEVEDAPYSAKIKAVASLVDSCWPAVLATASTFLNAALDDQYFRNLIKAYQRFAQVAGLLRLNTPRDALMTTLSKAAVPPHVLNAATSEPIRSPATESPRVFSNPKMMLSVDSLVSQATSMSLERKETVKPILTVRNLLCLRALLNLAIALGPTLGSAFAVIVNALKQADIVLSTTTPREMTRQSSMSGRQADEASIVQAFSSEVAAVEAAASRLLESTADYPSDAFMTVLTTFAQLLHTKPPELPSPSSSSPRLEQSPSPPATPMSTGRRTLSGLPGISTFAEMQARDYHFVIPKLGTLAELNVSRFTGEDAATSGWTILVDELAAVARTNDSPREARRSATNVLVKLSEATTADVMKEEPDDRAVVQRRALAVLLRLIDEIYTEDSDLTTADLEVQHHVLDSLRAILERCGDSLVAGWNRIVAIISSAFEHEGATTRGNDDDEVNIDWNEVSFELVSVQIGRIAFSATQLVCSDFMGALPTHVVPSLIELLHRFMCQTEDLNASLTTVTMAWNVSDIIFGEISDDELSKFLQEAQDFDDLEADLQPKLRDSKPAQWLLLLLRLRDVTTRPLNDIRNAAFQTICNVFKNHGQELPPPAWDILLRSTLLSISRSDSYLYLQAEEEDSESKATPDIGMSKTIIAGNSTVIAQHLRVIEQISKLPSLWEIFLSMLERYLDIEDHTLNTEVYAALSRVLSNIDASNQVWKGPVYRTVSLWLKGIPHQADSSKKHSNQDAFQAYAEVGEELYRLTKDTMSTSQTRTMIDNLYQCVRESDAPLYGADATNLSTLQARVLQLLRTMRHDQSNIPSCLVTVAAKLSALHHETSDGTKTNTKPTFVAIASESMSWLQELVVEHIADEELLESGALTEAILSLRQVIASKYAYRLEHRGTPLWRKATSTAIALAKPVLDQISDAATNTQTRHAIWSEYVAIASGIISANAIDLVNDETKIESDLHFDIESFHALRQILIPRLGSPDVPPETRTAYTRALFTASIITQPEFDRIQLPDEPLKDILQIRRGRVKHVTNFRREEMCYVCWKELIALSSGEGEYLRPLAQAAAPLLILRLALPLRAYIADQPLRGRRPQPLVEVEELGFALDTVQDLRLVDGVVEGGHVRVLYPLLARAVGVAGDKWSGDGQVLERVRGVLEGVGSAGLG